MSDRNVHHRLPEPHLPDLTAGVYRHYKGPLYLVLGYGHDANVDGRATVVYVGIQWQPAHVGPRLATRTAISDDPAVDAFFDWVHPVDGSKCTEFPEHCPIVAGRSHDEILDHCQYGRVRRFEYQGPDARQRPEGNIHE